MSPELTTTKGSWLVFGMLITRIAVVITLYKSFIPWGFALRLDDLQVSG